MLSELAKRIPQQDLPELRIEIADMLHRANSGMELTQLLTAKLAADMPELGAADRTEFARRIVNTTADFIRRTAADDQPLAERLNILAESLDDKTGDNMLRAVAEFTQSAHAYSMYGRLTAADEAEIHDIETLGRDELLRRIHQSAQHGFCADAANEHLLEALRIAGDDSALQGAALLQLEDERKQAVFSAWSYIIWRQAVRGSITGLDKGISCDEAALFTCATINRAIIADRERTGLITAAQAQTEYSRNNGAFLECLAVALTAALTVAGTAAAVSLIMSAFGAILPIGTGALCTIVAASILMMFGVQRVAKGCNSALGWIIRSLRNFGGMAANG